MGNGLMKEYIDNISKQEKKIGKSDIEIAIETTDRDDMWESIKLTREEIVIGVVALLVVFLAGVFFGYLIFN